MSRPERAFIRSLLWMTAGGAVAVPALVLPQPHDPLPTTLVHLTLVAVFSSGLTFHLAPLADDPWFDGLALGHGARLALSWVGVMVLVAAATGLTTVTTAAALRYDPSLQLLVLVAALGIGAITDAVALGVRRRFGAAAAAATAASVCVVCIWAVWRYLDTVGFSAGGGWHPNALEWRRLVLPYHLAAAALAVAAFSTGVTGTRADA